jgi:hypothetical protein
MSVETLNDLIFVVGVLKVGGTDRASLAVLFRVCEVCLWVIVVWVIEVIDATCWLIDITITRTARAVFTLARGRG